MRTFSTAYLIIIPDMYLAMGLIMLSHIFSFCMRYVIIHIAIICDGGRPARPSLLGSVFWSDASKYRARA
jgi:hypothetical protein